ncbi:MAG: TIGR04190 family B12-binding domain/radical SAM domain protein [Chloroflexia bacterium]|nr:TIGR04190 family B12-binding domain/radical SAM domain protein [Chloroflexia bacterium]
MAAKMDLLLLHAPSVYDFRREAILYGPVSDLIPSGPIFEMYPIGFSTMAEYLERHGFRVRIVNLAARMLQDDGFDVPAFLSRMRPAAFGIDLHWLPHAHGSLAVAELLKGLHPDIPIIFGGISSSYYQRELLQYPYVDYVVRGDSTEEPLRQLLQALRDGDDLAAIPNLSWRQDGQVRANPLSWVPENLDSIVLDYRQLLRSVPRYMDLRSALPFDRWMDYPITAALSVRGCTRPCLTCGGSAYGYRQVCGRARPAFRSPEVLAQDLAAVRRFNNGPIFILGDLQQAGEDYAYRFLEAAERLRIGGEVIVELFSPAPAEFLRRVGRVFPGFVLEISLESHDPRVRRAFGKHYDNEPVEATLEAALEAGAGRLDVFFMIGLPEQDPASVLDTAAYAGELLQRYGGDGRLYPFISPLAPFLDPGSRAFEEPDQHGYQIRFHTLEQHRQALLGPTWLQTLNYATRWLSREQIVQVSYEAGRRFNRLKLQHGLVDSALAREVAERIDRAEAMVERVSRLWEAGDREAIRALKPQIDRLSISTVCEKSELDLPGRGLNWLGAAWAYLRYACQDLLGS